MKKMYKNARDGALQTLGTMGFDLEAIVSGAALRDFLKRLKECPDRLSDDVPTETELSREFNVHYNGKSIFFSMSPEECIEFLRGDERYSQFSLSNPYRGESMAQFESSAHPVKVQIRGATETTFFSDPNPSGDYKHDHRILQQNCFRTAVTSYDDKTTGDPILKYRNIANEVIYLAERALERKIPLCIPRTVGTRHFPPEIKNPDGTYSVVLSTDPNFSRPVYYLPG